MAVNKSEWLYHLRVSFKQKNLIEVLLITKKNLVKASFNIKNFFKTSFNTTKNQELHQELYEISFILTGSCKKNWNYLKRDDVRSVVQACWIIIKNLDSIQ